MSVPEIVDDLRARAAGHRLPVVVLWSSHQERQAGQHSGAEALVAKPIRQGRLHSAVTRALEPTPVRRHGDRARAGHASNGAAATRAVDVVPLLQVLLAEDNKVNQIVTTRMLEKQGFHVEVAENGRAALEMSEGQQYAAIFMDCHMPDLDGYQATAEIRRRETSDWHVPIIALTASTLTGDREKCLAAGMDDYLAKPINAVSLAAAIARSVRPIDG
jgi:CheY-like chemotaxis protein